jgi:hypothetical protein
MQPDPEDYAMLLYGNSEETYKKLKKYGQNCPKCLHFSLYMYLHFMHLTDPLIKQAEHTTQLLFSFVRL